MNNFKLIFILIIVSVMSNITLSQDKELRYEQDVHKYLTVQGWNLVRSAHPEVRFSEMQRRMNDNNNIYGVWNNTWFDGTAPWQKGRILTGAFREDEEDVVYDEQGLFNISVTNTHFWDHNGEGGDDWTFSPPECGTYENAYKKIKAMWDGKRIVNGQEVGVSTLGIFFYNAIPFYVKVKYTNLANAYKDPFNNIFVTHWYDIGIGGWVQEPNNPKFYDFIIGNTYPVLSNAEILGWTRRMIWETVGRMTHLIADMGVPAHAHGSWHVSETYEKEYMPYHFQNWNSNHVTNGLLNINNKY